MEPGHASHSIYTDHVNPTWSPDGERIAFTSDRQGIRDIYVMPATGGEGEVLLESKSHKSVEDWSPDGRWIAYTSNESGSLEVYVQPFPVNGKKYQSRLAAARSRNGAATAKSCFM